MADGTKIEWADSTWQITTGCSVTSPGCTNCYAMRLAGGRLRNHRSRTGLTQDSKGGPVWNGEVRFNEQWLAQPLQWKKPRRIFVSAHGDLFHESIPDEWIDRAFAVMTLAPQHTFLVLTKRSKRMRRYLKPLDSRRADSLGEKVIALGYREPLELLRWPLSNVWLGVSVEDQQRADDRIPDLLATPAAVRFISAEPLLGPVDMTNIGGEWSALDDGADDGVRPSPVIDWVIVGGESGPAARPFKTEWAEHIVWQCQRAGVACFVKQLGANVIQNGERRIKRDPKGGDMSEWPHEIRVREMPHV